jgi:hypothetical protein
MRRSIARRSAIQLPSADFGDDEVTHSSLGVANAA